MKNSMNDPQPSALSPQPSALSPQPSALSPQPSALSPQPTPLVAWPGGKRRLLKHLLSLVPERHVCYVECFGGGAAMLFAKQRSKVEVYNDVDGQLVNLMRQVKYHAAEVVREMECLPNSRELFKEFLAQPGVTEIQRAVRFLLGNRTSFGGMGRHYGTTKVTGGGGGNFRQARLRENIAAVSARLDGVNIEREDWRELIRRYDGEGTFFFFDPPYTECSRTSYDPWTAETMREFRKALDGLKGQWLLTVNDSPAVREIFSGCEMVGIERANGIERRADRIKNAIYRELIVRPIS
jgi:DNA adenine methylase